jgi:pimeloyl-ACP methyl ester carboxylesterase
MLVLHDLGDAAGGALWRASVGDRVLAPDLPGHGEAPAPVNGAYDPGVVIVAGRRALLDAGAEPAIVVGCGTQAYAATVLAIGGFASGLVLLDGLQGRWHSADESVAVMYAWVRAIADDPDALAPAPAPGPNSLDPRTSHGYGASPTEWFAQDFWAAVPVPTLLLETPESPTPAAERGERASWFAHSTLVEIPNPAPTTVLEAITAWRHA